MNELEEKPDNCYTNASNLSLHSSNWTNRVPQFPPVFPSKVCPLYTDARRNKWIEELETYSGLIGRGQRYRCLVAIDYTPFIFHMLTDVNKLEILCKMIGWLQIADDHGDNLKTIPDQKHERVRQFWTDCRIVLDKLLEPGFDNPDKFIPMHQCHPHNMLLYALSENLCLGYDKKQRKRFVETFDFYIMGNVDEDLNVEANEKAGFDLEALKKTKMRTSATYPVVQWFEYALNIRVSARDWNDPHMQEAIRLCSLHVAFTNDVLSFDKEIIEEKGNTDRLYFKNSVQYFMTTEGLTREKGMDRVIGLIRDYEQKIIGIQKEFCGRSDVGPDGKTLMAHLHNVFVGNHYALEVMGERMDIKSYD